MQNDVFSLVPLFMDGIKMKSNFTTPTAPQPKKPTSILKLFQVPWTSAQTDTMIFKTKAAQETYFKNAYDYSLHLPDSTSNPDLCCAFTFNQCRPFRIGEPFAMHISVAAAMRCSYFSYYDEISKKTWYGFIRSATWINRNLTLITYDVDPIQTYMFEAIIDSSKSGAVELPQCYVEREHTSTDNYFEHRIPEELMPYEVQPKQIINLFNLLNSDGTSTPHYYLLIAKYYLFSEDICRKRSPKVGTFSKTGPNGVLEWMSATYEPGGGTYQMQKYGKNNAMLYYYVIPQNLLAKTLVEISTLAARNNSLWDQLTGTGLTTSDFSNLLAVIPIPDLLVKKRTQPPEFDNGDAYLYAMNNTLYHIYDTTVYDSSAYTEKVKDGTDYECYQDSDSTGTVLTLIKTELTNRWRTFWWQQYTLISPNDAIATKSIDIPISYTPTHKKCYNDETISVTISCLEQSMTIVPSRLFNGELRAKLYLYATLSQNLNIVISSTPVNNWTNYTENSNYQFLSVSVPITGVTVVNDKTTNWLEAQNQSKLLAVTTALSLVPSLGTMAMMKLAHTASFTNTRSIAEAMYSTQQANANMATAIDKYNREMSWFGEVPPEQQQAQNRAELNKYKAQFNLASAQANYDEAYAESQKQAAITKIDNQLQHKALKTLGRGISYALPALSQIAQAALQHQSNLRQALMTAPQVIGSSTPLQPYNLNWPMIIITEPSEDAFAQIDDYFNMFGYKVNKLKVPELFGRQYWNYVKTNGLKIDPYAACPDDAKRAIEAIFDNGIRLHHGTYRQKQKVADYKNVLETSSGAADIVTTQISDTRTLTHIPTSDDYEKVDLQDKQAL
jgi:hypothetical protein